MTSIEIVPGQLTLQHLRSIAEGSIQISLSPDTEARVSAASQHIEALIQNNHPIYGINTGLGALARVSVSREDLVKLQHNMILSHCVGVGHFLEDSIVRLILVLKINSLAQGYSGVRYRIIEILTILFNKGMYPCIPEKGSVGASGDLAPLAHLAAVLLGEGKVRWQGEIIEARKMLSLLGLEPLTFAPKEALALLNGTQVSTALALAGVLAAENNLQAAIVTGSLSTDAAMGSDVPFDPRIHQVRGHIPQQTVAAIYKDLLHGSQIRESHRQCERIQDPYSLRCQPQVMGACLQQIQHAAAILQMEANGVSDNPLIFENGEILSGGNFHAEPVAFAADGLAICIAEIGSLCERRIALLMDRTLSGLPAFLVNEAGVNSGFMMVQVTAAALVSENKVLAHPASVDSIPTSANQEDHVSMATYAARRLQEMNDNLATIIAIELLAACQGIDLRQPLKTSQKLQQVLALLRSQVPFYAQDRYFSPDIHLAKHLVQSSQLSAYVGKLC